MLLVAVLLLGGVVGRLAQLQLLDHPELADQAAAVSTRTLTEPALRGRLLAADGTVLADNDPTTVLTLDPSMLVELPEEELRALVDDVAAALDLPADRLWGRTRVCGTPQAPPAPSCFTGSPYQPVPLAYDVDPVAALAVLERPEDFPGVTVETRPVRAHPAEASATHVLGYLGRPTAEEVDQGLAPEALVGRAGLEQVYDEQLRGTDGRTTVTVDPRGVVTGRLDHQDPVPGLDVRTHLEPRVQRRAEEVIADAVSSARDAGRPADSAAAVVLDVRTGGVVAAASWPDYDLDVWTGGISHEQYEALLDPEAGSPLRNRVVGDTFPPASTFKVVSLPAALRHGVDPEREYPCPGSVRIGDRTFTNYESEAHGPLTVEEIVEVSCDTAFYRWAHRNWQDIGGVNQDADLRDPYVLLAQDFGFGEPTGVDLPGEAAGRVPGREWKRGYWQATREDSCARAERGYPEEPDRARREFLEQLAEENCTDGWQYRAGDAVNLSIGQGDLAATPLQVASAYAAVANGGTLWQPQVAAALQDQRGQVVSQLDPEPIGDLGLTRRELAVLRDGLDGVNTDGTGAAAFTGFDLDSYPVAGKTGSAESFGRRATAWYASYGPLPEPRYAVVVVVEQGGIGGTVAAPAARDIWEVLRRLDR
ncbi:penicillin-binding protein 2 [Ornithinicoccus halotolerans]|uniref:penicillin-binding protein 2 n=1 Tax=Ornithinicoccus halotolerans TaxID=1748220 RepID=UPI001295CFC8|nr:penicillin-binding protein 2 [Ornithinicoccus halotolerans]